MTYYAITGIGWGRGDTIDEALTNYFAHQRRNFRGITDTELDEAWGFVWQAPEGATGFTLDLVLYWQFEDGPPEQADPLQRVWPIGSVPASAMASLEQLRASRKDVSK
jgi:hypothetical protein